MEDPFAKQLPLPWPKRYFYKKPTPLPRPRKLAHAEINISVKDLDIFEEKNVYKKQIVWLDNSLYSWAYKKRWVVLRKRIIGLFKTNTTKDY